MTLTLKNAAPNFSLLDAFEKERSLKDFSGKWVVLYFYPKDDTPGCTTEACEFTSSMQDFDGLNATVLGVSPDSPARHRKFIDTHSLRVTLLSDPEHTLMEACGAWGKKTVYGNETMGVIRSTVIIDPQGAIAYCWPTVTAKGHASEVKAKLEELQDAHQD